MIPGGGSLAATAIASDAGLTPPAQTLSVTGSGGVVVGGTAPDAFSYAAPPTTGGVRVGGTADEVRGEAAVGAGGVTVGGVAGERRGVVFVGSGGVVIGGAAPTVFTSLGARTHIHFGPHLPTFCIPGDVYIKTGTGAGFYYALVANTWIGPVLT